MFNPKEFNPKQELDAHSARMIIDGLNDLDLVESILITANERKTQLRISAMKEAVVTIKLGEEDLAFINSATERLETASECIPSVHNKALDVANAAMDGFAGSHMERACLFVTTYAAALKVVAA